MLTPSSSEIRFGVGTSVTVGVPSSSVIVSVFEAGAARPVNPLTVAATVTSLSGASSSLSLPVTVTIPVLSVCLGAMVSTRAVLSSKSPATAGVTAAADTVTRISSLVPWLNRAVTVLTPRFSETSSGESTSVTVGAPSSSVIVKSSRQAPPGPSSH